MAERSPPLASDIDNLVVLHAANPSDHHDTGPFFITSKFHVSKESVPIIRRIVTMRFILFQMYVNYLTKQRANQIIMLVKKKKYQTTDKNTAYLLFDAIIRNRI